MSAGTNQAVKKGEQPRRPVFTWRRMVIVLSVLVLFVAAILAIPWWRQSYTTRAMRLLVRAFSQQRPVVGRLADGFIGGRFVPPVEDDALLQSKEIIEASRLTDKAMSANEPGARLVYARLLLLTGEKGPATLKAFRQVVLADPASAAARNDLGVCLMARNQLEEALKAFDEALRQQPEMTEALFNRALCYQQLQLRDAASTDFARLLEIDGDRSWREELRQYHQSVSAVIPPEKELKQVAAAFDAAFAEDHLSEAAQVAGENPELCFQHAYRNGYPEALKALTLGDAEARDRELAKIELIGQRVTAACGDKSLIDLAKHGRGLTVERARDEIGLLHDYLDVEGLLTPKSVSDRQASIQKTEKGFQQSGNAFFEYCSIYLDANFDYNSNRFAVAKAKMQETLNLAESRGWPYRRAIALVQMGNICARLGQDSLALEYGKQAMVEGRGTLGIKAKANQVLALAYWHLGNSELGLPLLRESSQLFSTETMSSVVDLTTNSLLAADFYRLMDNHPLALLFAGQALRYAEAERQYSSRIAQTVSFIAVEMARLKQFDESQSEMQRAFATLEHLPAHRLPYSKLLVLLRAGDIASQRGDLPLAEQHYAQAQEIAETIEEKPLPLIKVLKARAASYARAGQWERARDDLDQAIAWIEWYRKNIVERSNRSDFFDASQDVFDQMIQLKAHAFGQWAEAFNTSEQARARTLLDDLSPATGEAMKKPLSQSTAAPHSVSPLTLDEIRRALPVGLTLISYSVTGEGTLIFVVTRDDFTVATSEAATETLDRLVQDYVNALAERGPVEELAEQSHRLYQLLIAPVESKLSGAQHLCIAPDKALHRLPFAALLDAAGNYLIQSHVLTSAPSASTLARCLEEARRKHAVADEKLLAVGNPLFSRDHFPELPPLPEAEREASESATYYTHKEVLTTWRATKARTLAELETCDVAHFSTHCLVNEKTPWLAALVLAQASEDKEDELLQLNEFNKIGLLRARLVLLSACQSALGQYYRGEGIVSLVRPFLARNVPTVIASLWPVDSQATATLMIDFHKIRRQNGRPAADALRAAQIQMMQSALFNHPYYWAPFVVIGSST
jgi:CHAT domain-containing protein